MLMTKDQWRAIRTLRGWAISVLQEAGAIRECEEHGWMQDRADSNARERALTLANEGLPPGIPPDKPVAEIRDVLDSIGQTALSARPKTRRTGIGHRRQRDMA